MLDGRHGCLLNSLKIKNSPDSWPSLKLQEKRKFLSWRHQKGQPFDSFVYPFGQCKISPQTHIMAYIPHPLCTSFTQSLFCFLTSSFDPSSQCSLSSRLTAVEQKAWTGVGNWGKEAEGTQSMCPLGLAVSSLGVGGNFLRASAFKFYLLSNGQQIHNSHALSTPWSPTSRDSFCC